MKELTLTPHELVDVGDIILALQEAGINKTHKVVLYALAKGIAVSYAHLPPHEMISFLDDLKNAAIVCYDNPTAVPPEPSEEPDAGN